MVAPTILPYIWRCVNASTRSTTVVHCSTKIHFSLLARHFSSHCSYLIEFFGKIRFSIQQHLEYSKACGKTPPHRDLRPPPSRSHTLRVLVAPTRACALPIRIARLRV